MLLQNQLYPSGMSDGILHEAYSKAKVFTTEQARQSKDKNTEENLDSS